MTSSRLLAAVIALLVCFLATTVSAETFKRLPCIEWTGPSADNEFYDSGVTCKTDEVIAWLIPRVIAGVIFMVLSLIVFLLCPFVFSARYCCGCCGSYKQRPGTCCCGGSEWDERDEADRFEGYTEQEVKCTKYSTFFLAGLGVLIIILVYTGVAKLVNGIDDLRDGLTDGIHFFQGIITDIRDEIRRSDGTSPMKDSDFRSIQDILDDMKKDLVDGTEDYRDFIRELGSLVGYTAFVPAAILGATVIAAMLNIRNCLPAILVVLCFFFQLLYCYTGGAISLGNLLLIKPLCVEVEAQQDKAIGVFQWYFIPVCDREAPFKTLQENMEKAERTALQESCDSLSHICSPPEDYDPARPDEVYQCNMTNCGSSFRALEETIANMPVKNGAGLLMCDVPDKCKTLKDCAEHCTGHRKTFAVTTLRSFEDAQNLLDAMKKHVLPWLDCGALIDKINDLCFVTTCGFLPQGLDLLTAGFLVTGVALWICIVVTLRGQKRWINKEKYHNLDFTKPAMQGRYVNQNGAVVMKMDPYGDGGGKEMSTYNSSSGGGGTLNAPLLDNNNGQQAERPYYEEPRKQHPISKEDDAIL